MTKEKFFPGDVVEIKGHFGNWVCIVLFDNTEHNIMKYQHLKVFVLEASYTKQTYGDDWGFGTVVSGYLATSGRTTLLGRLK